MKTEAANCTQKKHVGGARGHADLNEPGQQRKLINFFTDTDLVNPHTHNVSSLTIMLNVETCERRCLVYNRVSRSDLGMIRNSGNHSQISK